MAELDIGALHLVLPGFTAPRSDALARAIARGLQDADALAGSERMVPELNLLLAGVAGESDEALAARIVRDIIGQLGRIA